jgi:hypothetical protein
LSGTVEYTTADVCSWEIPAKWSVSWTIQPSTEAPPTVAETVDEACEGEGSAIAVENQSLGEMVDIVGTPFQLRYQSERLPGRQGAAWDARSVGLGGWTLDVNHAYNPAGNTLHLGDGTTRSSASLGTVTQVSGEEWPAPPHPRRPDERGTLSVRL